VKEGITDRVAAIEASELYEGYLKSLKHSMNTIELSSALFSTEDKLKLNIELERLSKNISRIPIYMSKPEQYYETLQLYARSINNQLNNLVLIFNRCHHKSHRLKEATQG
jgi:gamma-glutamylcysteine synthetase